MVTPDERAALVEKVKALFYGAVTGRKIDEDFAAAAIALIRNEVLEEAARVADARATLPATHDRFHDAGWNNCAISTAAAIRALKEKNNAR